MPAAIDTRAAYLALVALVAAERLLELFLSRRNAARAFARGGYETEPRALYALLVAGHTLFLAACALEVQLARRPFLPALGAAMLALVAGAMALRYWAVSALGDRWNTRIIVVPGEPVVAGGPYRYLRHPNYLAVLVEAFALPLVHTAWATALAATAGNALLLAVRIRGEERALERASDYAARLGDRPRLLPGRRAR
jgi:methyltransferase